MRAALKSAHFKDVRTLHFPQCTYPSGWWSATLAGKDSTVAAFREAAAAEKTFTTRYYNADLHKAALALPEFLKVS
jgi:spermidine synthase